MDVISKNNDFLGFILTESFFKESNLYVKYHLCSFLAVVTQDSILSEGHYSFLLSKHFLGFVNNLMLQTFENGFGISVETAISTLESCLAIFQNFSIVRSEYKTLIVREGFLNGIAKSILESELEIPKNENPEEDTKGKVDKQWKEL